MYKQYYAIRVGQKNNGYFMDNTVFEFKKDAVAYKKQFEPCHWSNEWHIVKITEGSEK